LRRKRYLRGRQAENLLRERDPPDGPTKNLRRKPDPPDEKAKNLRRKPPLQFGQARNILRETSQPQLQRIPAATLPDIALFKPKSFS
jgi:hypothetical protein